MRYRLVGALMAALFCVFTIGVPVVLASCPMMGQPSSAARLSCCPSSVERGQPILSAYKNTSCCATKIAAARNTQEFVQSFADLQKATGAAFLPAVLLIPSAVPSPLVGLAQLAAEGPPAVSPVSLPILHAALLI